MEIMDFGLSVESAAANIKMSRRRRPLLACGVSIFAIASKAYTKTQDLNGPIGSMTKRMSALATSMLPFVHAMQYQCLAVLSFADDHILAFGNVIETLFPPSTRLFDKIDEFVHTAETLPGKFDNAVNKFPKIIQQVLFLDWISTLIHWGSNNTREKEIKVDFNCNNNKKESESAVKAYFTKTVMKCSYKEMLEKGTKESTENKEDSLAAITSKRKAEEDPILELFETSWHMKPGKGGK